MLKAITDGSENCQCHRCRGERAAKLDPPDTSEACAEWLQQVPLMMVVCSDCGNKRCPKASNHELACTDSNDPGQPGSIYE